MERRKRGEESKRKNKERSSCCGSVEINLTNKDEVVGLIPDHAQQVKGYGIAVSCRVRHRCGSDTSLLWV